MATGQPLTGPVLYPPIRPASIGGSRGLFAAMATEAFLPPPQSICLGKHGGHHVTIGGQN